MATVTRKSTSKTTAEKTAKEKNYSWGSSGPSFWNKDKGTVLQSVLRKNDDYKNYELVLRIQELDDEGKFVKDESGKYVNGFFTFNANDVLMVAHQLELLFPTHDIDNGSIAGIIVNHIRPSDNTGSQFEITIEEDGIFVSILYVENGEVTSMYQHLLSNDRSMRYYDAENGEEAESVINLDILAIKTLFASAYANVSGLTDSIFEANRFNINNKSEARSGGKINDGGLNRRVRSTLGSKKSTDVDDVSEDDDEVPVSKKRNPTRKASSMRQLLEDDDDDEDSD